MALAATGEWHLGLRGCGVSKSKRRSRPDLITTLLYSSNRIPASIGATPTTNTARSATSNTHAASAPSMEGRTDTLKRGLASPETAAWTPPAVYGFGSLPSSARVSSKLPRAPKAGIISQWLAVRL